VADKQYHHGAINTNCERYNKSHRHLGTSLIACPTNMFKSPRNQDNEGNTKPRMPESSRSAFSKRAAGVRHKR